MSARRRFAGVVLPVATFLAGLAATVAAQQRDLSQVSITTVDLGHGIHMLMGAGGNMGLSVGEDGALLVDDEFAPLSDKIVAAVQAIDQRPIRFVVNTHWHFDHVGGNENLAATGALLVAHDNVRARMAIDQVNEIMGRTIPAAPAAALPVVTFSDQLTFHLNGGTIRLLHVPPAHTDGDAMVYFEGADVLHTGDLFFNGSYPFIDVSVGGSIGGMIEACDRALELVGPDTRIIPGHGPLARRADLEAFRDMLADVQEAVVPLVAGFKSLDEVWALDPLAPFNERWGKGMDPDRFLAIVYASVTR